MSLHVNTVLGKIFVENYTLIRAHGKIVLEHYKNPNNKEFFI